MTVAIIKSVGEPDLMFSEGSALLGKQISGQIRLWSDGTPSIPSRIWVIIGDFELTDDPALVKPRVKDLAACDVKINEILTRIRKQLSDYGVFGDEMRSFHMDIKVPQSIIDYYWN